MWPFKRQRGRELEFVELSCDNFHQEVAGESFHQEAIRAVVEESGQEFQVFLMPEPQNKFDRNAIAVVHSEHGALGHLPREVAAYIAPSLSRLWQSQPPRVAACRARAAGGGPGRSLGLWLDCDLSSVGGDEPPAEFREFRPAIAAVVRTTADEERRRAYLAFADRCVDAPLQGMRVVITGGLVHWERDECVRMLERLGARVTQSVSGKTTHLIVGESPGSKLARAQETGCAILSEREFIDQILEPAFQEWKGARR